MKLSELAAIKENMKGKVAIRSGEKANRIVVSMGDYGLASGAREILHTFVEAIDKEKLWESVSVVQSGAIGIAGYETIVEVDTADGVKTIYEKMTPAKALEVVEKHIKGGVVITEYTKDGGNR